MISYSRTNFLAMSLKVDGKVLCETHLHGALPKSIMKSTWTSYFDIVGGYFIIFTRDEHLTKKKVSYLNVVRQTVQTD